MNLALMWVVVEFFLGALSKFFLMNYHDWQSLPRPISSRISSNFGLHG